LAFAQQSPEQTDRQMRFGLVTYLWGHDWDLPTLLANCQRAEVFGVELRTTHAHGVEPSLSAAQRREVRSRFDGSPVTCVGLGSNERFDHPDPAELAKAIERVKEFVRLSHDVGGSGVKVKPNDLPPGVPREKTIEQIGRSLNEVGRFAAEHDQQIRLEVHGQCAELPIMRQIMDVADHPSVAVCWNSNEQDLAGSGLRYNFNLVKDRFGDTCHVHALDDGAYPYDQLLRLLTAMNYRGWVLLEASGEPEDRVAALARQRMLFDRMVLAARQ
jgi:sugar phosphate isomerase/epimerase